MAIRSLYVEFEDADCHTQCAHWVRNDGEDLILVAFPHQSAANSQMPSVRTVNTPGWTLLLLCGNSPSGRPYICLIPLKMLKISCKKLLTIYYTRGKILE